MDEGIDEDFFSGPPDPYTNSPKKGRAEKIPAFFMVAPSCNFFGYFLL